MAGAAPEQDDEALIDEALAEAERQAEDRREARRDAGGGYSNSSIPEVVDAVGFVWAASASGVVGNLAYDLLKQAVAAAARRRTKPARAKDLLRDRALHAVREMCHRYDLEAPELDDMRVRWTYSKAGATAHVTCRRSALTAKVGIPYSDREGRGVDVRIVTQSGAGRVKG